jgi:hypothetical protein
MRRGFLFLATLLAVLAVAPAASATKPIRVINPSQGDTVIRHQCAFPVFAHVDGPEIITTFLNKAGDPVKQIGVFPGNTLSMTNVRTGASVTFGATGSFHVRALPDGEISVQITGKGPFFPHPLTGEPGIWYLVGRAKATFDADGNMTSGEIVGQLIDVCAELAS